MRKYGRTFEQTPCGGWIEAGATLPAKSTATIAGNAMVFKEAACNMHGGTFRGGTFHGGWFRGGTFHGGDFRGGTFHGGWFRRGTFHGGDFRGGTFHGGEFNKSPSTAQRSDGYVFVAKTVKEELRIWAGCRNFSWDEAVDHWNNDHPHGKESQRIIYFLKAQEEAAQ
jgi:hypothetical protein